jgi:hypothetical protein
MSNPQKLHEEISASYWKSCSLQQVGGSLGRWAVDYGFSPRCSAKHRSGHSENASNWQKI